MDTSFVDKGSEAQSSEEADENVVNSGRNDPELVFVVNNVIVGDVIEYLDWFLIELTEDDENVSLELLIVSLLL